MASFAPFSCVIEAATMANDANESNNFDGSLIPYAAPLSSHGLRLGKIADGPIDGAETLDVSVNDRNGLRLHVAKLLAAAEAAAANEAVDIAGGT